MLSFSILTPTINRDPLVRCCASVDRQSYSHWQHIVQVDRIPADLSLLSRCDHPKREFHLCPVEHRNYGNTCRHLAWERATGDYLLHLDDDNYLAHPDVLAEIAAALHKPHPAWAVFPILRHGSIFFDPLPRSCHTDTANIVVEREIGRWPNRDEYTCDGLWAEALRAHYPFEVFPNLRPIVVMESSGLGQ